MNWLDGILITFTMYSILPMPQRTWHDKNMRWTMVWFPLIGIIIGGGWLAIYWLHSTIGLIDTALTAAALMLWPVLISGGLHFDGFADAADALGSHRDRETRLKIMKDPNAGPFAIISTFAVFLIQFAAWFDIVASGFNNSAKGLLLLKSEREWFAGILAIAFIPVFSRIFSGLSICFLPPARKDGLVKTFRDRLSPNTRIILIILLVLLCATWLWLDLAIAVFGLIAAIIAFVAYIFICKKIFGGTTGDLAGFFLVICETAMLVAVSLAI